MACENCPYIQDEYEIREGYFENNNDNFLAPGISSSCHCDKVGGKLGWFGYCEDAKHYYDPNYQLPPISSRKEKARKRRKNDIKYKHKLKWQAQNCQHYPSPSYPVDKHGNYTDDVNNIAYYKKTNKSSHSQRFSYYKNQANRAVRRYFDTIDTWEEYCFHEPWMDDDIEYMNMYCDEFGYEWDYREITDIHPKYNIGNGKSAYKRIFEYKWNIY